MKGSIETYKDLNKEKNNVNPIKKSCKKIKLFQNLDKKAPILGVKRLSHVNLEKKIFTKRLVRKKIDGLRSDVNAVPNDSSIDEAILLFGNDGGHNISKSVRKIFFLRILNLKLAMAIGLSLSTLSTLFFLGMSIIEFELKFGRIQFIQKKSNTKLTISSLMIYEYLKKTHLLNHQVLEHY